MWHFHFELIFIHYKQGRGETKGLGRLSGRSLASLWSALGSDWEPTAAARQGDAAGQPRELCMAVPQGAQSRLRLKESDSAGQREGLLAELGEGLILPTRAVMGKAAPALDVSLSPASSLLFFFFPSKERWGWSRIFVNRENCSVEADTC